MDKQFIYCDVGFEPRPFIQEAAAIMLDEMRRNLEERDFGDMRVNVAIPNLMYARGVIDSCKIMLRWTRDEINAYRHGRKFRGRYPARYAGR